MKESAKEVEYICVYLNILWMGAKSINPRQNNFFFFLSPLFSPMFDILYIFFFLGGSCFVLLLHALFLALAWCHPGTVISRPLFFRRSSERPKEKKKKRSLIIDDVLTAYGGG